MIQSTSLCIRCGKKRIVSKTWTEIINNSEVKFSLTVCPDPECQKIVEQELNQKKEKIIAIQKKSQERKKNNIRNRSRKNKSK